MQMNGFYDKNALSLKNNFNANTNKYLMPVDNRLHDQSQSFNQDNENKLYKPNEELLLEIERHQKMRELQRNKRQDED